MDSDDSGSGGRGDVTARGSDAVLAVVCGRARGGGGEGAQSPAWLSNGFVKQEYTVAVSDPMGTMAVYKSGLPLTGLVRPQPPPSPPAAAASPARGRGRSRLVPPGGPAPSPAGVSLLVASAVVDACSTARPGL